MDSARERRALAWTYPPHSFRCHMLHAMIVLLWLLQCCQALEFQEQKGIAIHAKIFLTSTTSSDAVLNCTVENLGARQIIWSKLSDPYPIAVGRAMFHPDKKYKVDVGANFSNLTIKNVRVDSAGEYQCRVSGQIYLAETLSLIIKAAQGNTHLLQTKINITAEVGSTVVLPCEVENLDNSVVLWKNDQNDVLSLRRKNIIGDKRLTVVHNTSTEWSLQIRNVRKSDFGLYTCIINSQPVLTRTVSLKDITPAQLSPILIQDGSFKKRLEVKSGETVTLTCNFKANPRAKVTWYRRKTGDEKSVKEVLGQGNVFTMRSVSPEQAGLYICQGDNSIKPVGKGKTKLDIIAPPTAAPVLEQTTFTAINPIAPVLFVDKTPVVQRMGWNAQLTCMAIGLPRPEIVWKRGSGPDIVTNYKYVVTTETHRRDLTKSVLSIIHVLKPDYGEYTCQGKNQLGLVSKYFELRAE